MSLASLPRHASPAQVAERLGVCTKTVRRMYKSGQLPAHRINNRVLIAHREVEALLRRSPCVPTTTTAVGFQGEPIPLSGPVLQMRKRRALAALADDAGPDDPEQVALADPSPISFATGGPD